MSEKYINPIDALFDENNSDPIVLLSEEGEEISLEQIALIPIEEKTYAILKPITPMEGIGEDEALVFSIEVNQEMGDEFLMLVVDEKIIDAVFDIYDDLVDSQYTKKQLSCSDSCFFM